MRAVSTPSSSTGPVTHTRWRASAAARKAKASRVVTVSGDRFGIGGVRPGRKALSETAEGAEAWAADRGDVGRRDPGSDPVAPSPQPVSRAAITPAAQT